MKQRSSITSLLLAAFLILPAAALALSEGDFKPLATGGFSAPPIDNSANSYSWGLHRI